MRSRGNNQVSLIFIKLHRYLCIAYFRSVDPKRIFALIIGVGKYGDSSVGRVWGAVNDAKMMKSFLVDDLKVDPLHIQLLVNGAATRQNILDGFDKLLCNPKVKRGDTILFYFTGNATRQAAPKGWESPEGMIELICPYDFGTLEGNGETQATHTVEPISNLALSTLFQRLTNKHGDNIVCQNPRKASPVLYSPHRFQYSIAVIQAA